MISNPPHIIHNPTLVIPAKAGTQGPAARRLPHWVPAFAGMTKKGG